MQKQVTLTQTGYLVTGITTLHLWGGGLGEIEMHPTFIPVGQMTKDNLTRALNDGGFGCQGIEKARLSIYNQYEKGYKEFNRRIHIENPDKELCFNYKDIPGGRRVKRCSV